jgi:tetratricopeptide (TPR) repeat protein
LERAEHLLTELLVQYPDVPEIRLNLSSVYLRKGQPEKAISVLEEVKKHRLFNASELFNYALACYQKGEFKDALVNLQKATSASYKFSLNDVSIKDSKCLERYFSIK